MTEADRERELIVAYMDRQCALFKLIADELPEAEIHAALRFVDMRTLLEIFANDIREMRHHATLAETNPGLH